MSLLPEEGDSELEALDKEMRAAALRVSLNMREMIYDGQSISDILAYYDREKPKLDALRDQWLAAGGRCPHGHDR